MGCFNVTTNYGGWPYFTTTGVTVGTENVDFSLGFRNIKPVGGFFVRIANQIPADATATLPVRLTLNGTTRELTFADGTPVTAGDLDGTVLIEVFNDRFNGMLILLSPAAAPTA